MLSANEFTTGSIGHAAPLTLVLPRRAHEETILIGGSAENPVAFFLSGTHRFRSFEATNNGSWFGLLIPDVRVEVDETSAFDSRYGQSRAGAVLRLDTRLVAQETGFAAQLVTLEDGLPTTSDGSVGFSRWHIVLGSGQEKRVLHVVSIDEVQSVP